MTDRHVAISHTAKRRQQVGQLIAGYDALTARGRPYVRIEDARTYATLLLRSPDVPTDQAIGRWHYFRLRELAPDLSSQKANIIYLYARAIHAALLAAESKDLHGE